MWNWNKMYDNKDYVMKLFFENVAGRQTVDIGNKTYYMPINYVTDEKDVIVNGDLPIINLKNKNLELFKDILAEYVRTYFASEKNWANPITNCNSEEEKIVHAIATLWLNATYGDYENPIQFISRYAQFVKDKTFDEFCDGIKINKVQTLRNCEIEIKKAEQEEFQETPDAIIFTIQIKDKEGKKIEKKLPRIAYGIADSKAYIYGIQGYPIQEDDPEMKKINRNRYKVNNMENIPEDYINVYKKQEPYAYISLFTFLVMLKEKGITTVIMPSYLPLRYEGKEIGLMERARELTEQVETSKERKEALKQIEHEVNNHQRVQYNITNKFLSYMSRMECDVPGIEIKQMPDENNLGMVIDISKMNPDEESTIIFYEIAKKIEAKMNLKEQEKGR